MRGALYRVRFGAAIVHRLGNQHRRNRLTPQDMQQGFATMPNEIDNTVPATIDNTPLDAAALEGGTLPATTNDAASRAGQAKDTAAKLGSQATDKFRQFADDGKARASGALGEFAKMIDDAAGQVDEKLGAQFGGYARQASGAVGSFADTLDAKSVDDLVEDARAFVQKSPAVAIGIAAAAGFVVARVLRSGIDRN